MKKGYMMIREIIKPQQEEYTIHIPKEYLNTEIEILILPFSYRPIKVSNAKNSATMVSLQEVSMLKTWDNSEDEAWDGL